MGEDEWTVVKGKSPAVFGVYEGDDERQAWGKIRTDQLALAGVVFSVDFLRGSGLALM